jgi:enoyl-CoA hydratase
VTDPIFDTLIVEQLERVQRLTLNRPEKRNPLSSKCIREITEAVGRAGQNRDISVIVIRGAGKAFSGGYGVAPEDVEPSDDRSEMTVQDDARAMIDLGAQWAKIWNCPIPVVAQVHGACLAGGTDLALHCDIVLVAEDARIGFPPVRSMGVPPTHMWLYNIGPQWTKRLLLTGDTVSGSEAVSIGLAQAAFPEADLDEAVLDLASRISFVGRDLLIGNKRVVNLGVELMGRSQLQTFSALSDALGHLAPEASAFSARVREAGFKQAVVERDQPFRSPGS